MGLERTAFCACHQASRRSFQTSTTSTKSGSGNEACASKYSKCCGNASLITSPTNGVALNSSFTLSTSALSPISTDCSELKLNSWSSEPSIETSRLISIGIVRPWLKSKAEE
ncbi:hypothetical protein D3C77_245390 [compost metagenome]